MDGVLVIDKPAGPTSHDIVARARRALGEPRVGHTGTLDPAASGVLALVLGRATRLARFLTAGDKSYEAVIHLGVSTDTADAQGAPVGDRYGGPWPTRVEIEAGLDPFRGRFLQQPPVYSAKKIDGTRSYRLARAEARRRTTASPDGSPPAADAESAALETAPEPLRRPVPVEVTTRALEILAFETDRLVLRVECSAGFYVRSLAHDLGERLGTGAHLSGLRRTRSGDYGLDDALSIDVVEHDLAAAVARVVPLASMLPRLSAVVLTPAGMTRARHGRELGPAEFAALPLRGATRERETATSSESDGWMRLLAPDGQLVGLGRQVSGSGLLHPSVVLI